MTTDVEKCDFLLGEFKSEHHTVRIGDPDGPTSAQLTTQWVQVQLGVERVSFQLAQHVMEFVDEIAMLF